MFQNTFPDRSIVAQAVAKMLLEIKAVHFRSTSLTRLPPASRARSISTAANSSPTRESALPSAISAAPPSCAMPVSRSSMSSPAAKPLAFPTPPSWLKDLRLPMIYIRKKPKGFGRNARIEGDLKEGQRVLFVEDLTTDGGSKIGFAEAIREAGAEVTDTFSVFYYDIFKDAPAQLAANGMALHYLTTWPDVLEETKRTRAFDEKTLKEVENFLNAPYDWSAANGGISERGGEGK